MYFKNSSVAQSWPTLCDPMDHSMPGLPVHHQLPEFTQTHVHWVGDAIQPSHLLSSPSPPAFNLSQCQVFSNESFELFSRGVFSLLVPPHFLKCLEVYPNPCSLSRWCHPTISSSVVPFFSYLQSLPPSGSFQMSQLFTLGGQSFGVSASTSVLHHQSRSPDLPLKKSVCRSGSNC